LKNAFVGTKGILQKKLGDAMLEKAAELIERDGSCHLHKN
jgi:hypothetical protein